MKKQCINKESKENKVSKS